MVIASSWFCSIVFNGISNAVIYIWITSTMDELDKASSLLSFGQLSLDLDRYFGTMVESSDKPLPFLSFGQHSLDLGRYFDLVSSCDFRFLLLFSGIAISHNSSRFFCLFSLSIFWILVGYLILFMIWLNLFYFGRLVALDSHSDWMVQHSPPIVDLTYSWSMIGITPWCTSSNLDS